MKYVALILLITSRGPIKYTVEPVVLVTVHVWGLDDRKGVTPALGQRLAWVCSAALCIGAGYTSCSLVFDDCSCKYKD